MVGVVYIDRKLIINRVKGTESRRSRYWTLHGHNRYKKKKKTSVFRSDIFSSFTAVYVPVFLVLFFFFHSDSFSIALSSRVPPIHTWRRSNLGWSQWTVRRNRPPAYPWAARGASVACSAAGFSTFPPRRFPPAAACFAALHIIIFELFTNVLLSWT